MKSKKSNRASALSRIVFASFVFSAGGISAQAAIDTWSATPTNADWEATGTQNNWGTVAAYPGSVGGTGNTDTAIFLNSNTTTIAINASTSNSSPLNIENITFGAASTSLSSFTIGATNGNALDLTSTGTITFLADTSAGSNLTETINAPIVIGTGSAAQTYSFTNNNATATNILVFGGGISGGTSGATTLTLGGLNTGSNAINGAISNGSGTLALTASGGSWTLAGANSYTGTTTVSAGTLTITGTNSGGGAYTLSGGTTTINSSGTVAASGVTINTTGTTLNLNGGTLTVGASGITVGTTAPTLNFNGGTLKSSAAFAISAGIHIEDLAGGATFDTTGGNITSTASSFADTGSSPGNLTVTGGNALALLFKNTTGSLTNYTGNTLVTGSSTLQITNAITVTGSLTVNSGSTFDMDGNSQSFGGLAGAGNVINSGTAGKTLIITGSTTSTFSGVYSGGTNSTTAGTSGLTLNSSTATETLSGANLYTGTTTLTAGTLIANNASALGGASAPLALNGGTLELEVAPTPAYNTTVGGAVTIKTDNTASNDTLGTLSIGANVLTVTGGSSVTSGTAGLAFGAVTSSGSSTFTVNNPTGGGTTLLTLASIAPTAATTLTFNGTGNTTVTGAIGGANSAAVTVNGTGIVTFSGNDSYTGVTTLGSSSSTIASTLVLTGSNTTSGQTNINNGTTLQAQANSGNTTGGSSGVLGTGGLSLGGTVSSTTLQFRAGSGTTAFTSGTVTGVGGGNTVTFDVNTDNSSTNGVISFGGFKYNNTNIDVTGGNGYSFSLGTLASTGSSAQLTLNATTANLTLAGITGFTSASGGVASAASINITGSGNTTVTGPITGWGAVNQSGSGVLTLGGTNTYSGGTTITAGTVNVSADANLGTAPGSATAGNLVINGGTLATTASFTLNSNRGIALGPTSGSGTGSIKVASGTNLAYAGAIANNGGTGSLASTGSGTLTLSGANTYSGSTTVAAGTLQFVNETSLYNNTTGSWTAANIAVQSGATLAFNVGGSGQFTTGDVGTLLTNLDGSVTTGGLLAGSTIGFDTTNASGGSFTISNAIANTTGSGGGAVGLIKLGTNTLVLSGANTYSGSTTVAAGTLQFVNETSLYNNTTGSWTAANIAVKSGATLAFNVGGSGQFTTGDVTTLLTNLDGSVTTGGLLAGSTIGFDTTNASGGTFTISNAIANTTGSGGGAVGLIKLGTNTLVLSGANTYTGGTTINNGVLVLANTGSLSSSGAVTINTGTLQLGNTATAFTTPTALNLVFKGNGSVTDGTGMGSTITLTTPSAASGTGGAIQLAAGATGTIASGVTVVDNVGMFINSTTSGASVPLGVLNLAGTLSASANVNVVNSILNVTSTGTIALTGAASLSTGGGGSSTTGDPAFINVSGGTVTFGTGSLFVSNGSGNNVGYSAMTLGYGGTGGSINATALDLAKSSQAGTAYFYLDSGTLTTGSVFNTNTNGSLTQTALFFNGGTLQAKGASSTFITGVGVSTFSGTVNNVGDSAGTGTSGSNTGSGGVYVGGANGVGGAVINTNGFNDTIAQTILSGNGIWGSTAYSNTGSTTDGGLTKAGSGTLVLSAVNTYNGGNSITGGTLESTLVGGLGSTSGALALSGGGILDIENVAQTVGAVTFGGGTLQSTGSAGLATLSASSASTSGSANNVIAGSTAGVNLAVSGNTTVNTGTLTVNGEITEATGVVSVGGGTLAGTGTVAGNATLSSGAISFSNPGNITGTLTATGGSWNGAGSVTGAVNATSGTFNIGSGANLTASSGLNVSGTGAISSTNSTGTITGSVNYTSSSSSTFGGVIAGSGNSLTLNNSASTLTLTGANTYGGGTTLTTGTLELLSAGGGSPPIATLGSTTAALTVNGTLDIEGTAGNYSANSVGILTVGALNGTGTITNLGLSAGGNSSNLIIGNGNASGTYAGSIDDGSEFITLTKEGTGTETLSGNSAYYTGTTITGGILSISSENNIGNTGGYATSGYGLFLGGGELLTTATTPILENVTLSPGATNTLAAATATTATYSGSIGESSSGSTLAFGDSVNTGTVVLSGSNYYTGATTVADGTLNVTGSTSSSSAVTVNSGATLVATGSVGGTVGVASGATLSGQGSTGAVTLVSGAKINLVDGSVGTLTVASLNTSGASLTFEIGANTMGSIDSIAAGTLTIGSGSTTITIENLNNLGSQTLALGNYTLLTYTNGTIPSNIGNLSLATTSLDGDTLSLSTSTLGSVILTVGGAVSNGQYTLTTTSSSLIAHAGGGTTTLSTTIKNTGTGTQDSVGYSGLTATAASGLVGSGTNTSGSALAQGATGATDTQTFTAGSAGNVTVGNSATVSNTSASGTPVATNVGTTINVYSGQSSWAATGTSGSWGTLTGVGSEAFGSNWGANQGSPGLDPGFTGVDTATFGTVAGGSSTDTINLNGAAPNLNAINFTSSSTSYTIAQGTGSNSITLSGTTPSINVTAGSHFISAPIILGANTALAVSSGDKLTVSGQISGSYGLSNTGSGTTILSSANIYTGGTTVSAGKIYINGGVSGTSSGTGSGAVTVNGGTLAGSGNITTSAGVTVNTGGTLASGDAQSISSGMVDGTHLTVTNTAVTIASANLTFDLGAGNPTSSGPQTFSNPNTSTTYMNLTGTSTLNFTAGGSDSVTLVDLTNTTGSNGSLSLRQETPYLLVAAGSDADYLNLVINSGTVANPVYSLSQNDTTTDGYVLGVWTGSGFGYNAITFNQLQSDGLTALTPGANGIYPDPVLYLQGGDLEVVPEPGTWALMLGGLALLVVIQRRRNSSVKFHKFS